MTDLDELIQDLRAHAPDAPAHCAALMRRSATELERRKLTSIGDVASRLNGAKPRAVTCG